MENHDLIVDGELSAPEPKKKKLPKAVSALINAALVAVISVTAYLSVSFLYFRAGYNLSFYVNGMSMYPTLNADCKNADGQYLTWNSGNNRIGDEVDFGYAKSGDKDNWRASLKRFDIVITYYRDDYIQNTDGSLKLKPNAASKIKRIIAFPGETVRFEPVREDTEYYNRAWGKTTINEGKEDEQVLKPLYTMDDFPAVNGKTYDYPTSSGAYGYVTLKENEYYVMGDNRAHSADSRTKGPVTAEMIIGKACIVLGKDKYTDNMSESKENIFGFFFTPWNYRRLD